MHSLQDGDAQEDGFFGSLFQEAESGSPGPSRSAGPDQEQAWEAVLLASLCEVEAVLLHAFLEAPIAEVTDSPCVNAIMYVVDLGLCSSSSTSTVGRQLATLGQKLLAGDGFSYTVKALLAPAPDAITAQILGKATKLRRMACCQMLQQVHLGEPCRTNPCCCCAAFQLSSSLSCYAARDESCLSYIHDCHQQDEAALSNTRPSMGTVLLSKRLLSFQSKLQVSRRSVWQITILQAEFSHEPDKATQSVHQHLSRGLRTAIHHSSMGAGFGAPCAFDLWTFYILSSHACAQGSLDHGVKDWLVADDRWVHCHAYWMLASQSFFPGQLHVIASNLEHCAFHAVMQAEVFQNQQLKL